MSEPSTPAASAQVHPAAPNHLPAFVPGPDGSDTLMVIAALLLLFAVLAFGLIFFRLHTLPERIAHRGHKLQFEIVAVLGLIALFTHMHIFWIIGLMLALIDIPDFGGSLARIAGSTEKMAGIAPPGEISDEQERPAPAVQRDEPHRVAGGNRDAGEREVVPAPIAAPMPAPMPSMLPASAPASVSASAPVPAKIGS